MCTAAQVLCRILNAVHPGFASCPLPFTQQSGAQSPPSNRPQPPAQWIAAAFSRSASGHNQSPVTAHAAAGGIVEHHNTRLGPDCGPSATRIVHGEVKSHFDRTLLPVISALLKSVQVGLAQATQGTAGSPMPATVGRPPPENSPCRMAWR